MMKIAKYALLATVVTLTPIMASSQAEARDRYRHHRDNDAVALGVLGLATGVIVGSAIASQPQRRVYVEPAPVYDEPEYYVDDYPPPPPPRRSVYQERRVSYGVEPWTPEWYDYCSNRYRSFNSRSGTYVGYDGMSHFCTAG
ncbi:BA14K family protein [Rhizobium sp. 18065]|uniref:BA14K family protein n=1 Tax=Rhizobium sp. 18065 TaxID=2681411 RepID=UPI00135748A6|nr:BA14K family protein [Rhizobium sp. 18065]